MQIKRRTLLKLGATYALNNMFTKSLFSDKIKNTTTCPKVKIAILGLGD